ncbi:oligopeptide transport system permease protein AppC [Treponema primitia ZAS-2]|uniref:Oligopeptide transport system permease protein AppC n=1 Tax=Treponema primitia (strain ATCC BAA-887 / DSM 12427 / ZAS-2) TaxID=545694 RepID=F5YLF9_TREPZ|nr:ABC transporter permease [Treponema primitia]AEF84278.1 oligopeptide transport system permease protein AppC [Treponema primitia ZAS-2]
MLKSLLKSKTGLLGAALVILVICIALFANIIAPADPNKQNLLNKYKPPAWYEGGSIDHLLGTDSLGRDELSRLVHGSRYTLMVAFVGTIVAGAAGVLLGSLSGYYGGIIDVAIMRIAEIQLAFPFVLLALFIAAVLGQGLGNVIFIAGLSGWVRYARVVRGEFMAIKEMEYIEAVRALGCRNMRIIYHHIMPNVISPIIVIGTLEIAKIVLMEASLSYLGVGIPIIIPTWGRMLSEAQVAIFNAPWLSALPGLFILLTVLGVNLFGDWLRDYLDPRLDV